MNSDYSKNTPTLYSIVYSGKILSGFNKQDVINSFQKITNLKTDQAEKFIARVDPVYIKKNVKKEIAKKYLKKLTNIGMDVQLRASNSSLDVTSNNERPGTPLKYKKSIRSHVKPIETKNNSTIKTQNYNKSNQAASKINNSSFGRIKVTRSLRALVSLAISLIFIVIVFTATSVHLQLGAVLFLFLPTLVSLYIYSGFFSIEGVRNKAIIITIIIAFFIFQIYKNIHFQNNSVGQSVFTAMILSALLLLICRSMISLVNR